MKPSESAALFPLHEAVSNSLHSIRDRFGDESAAQGQINIEILRSDIEGDESVIGFIVDDNGIGFTDENFLSFQTPDSQLKITRGGKGVGRLGWLKVFDRVSVDSVYKSGGNSLRRNFDFVLAPSDQIRSSIDGERTELSLRTKISLHGYRDVYGVYCPMKTEIIAERLVAHFLPTFVSRSAPQIVVRDPNGRIDLRDFFSERIRDEHEEDIAVLIGEAPISLHIRHMKCDKSIRHRAGKYNWLCLAAHDRSVKEFCIDEQIGLKTLGDDLIYLGCVSGDYLDTHVNPQRDNFIFDTEEETAIRRAAAEHVRIYLEEYIRDVMRQKVATTQSLIVENPQFLYLSAEIESFVEELPPNSTNKEQIFVDMARHRYRRQRDFKRVEGVISNSEQYSEAVEEKVDEYKKYIQDEQRGALAEYVVKRKAVLDLLDKLRGFENPESERHHLEEAIHKLLCPMRIDSSKLEIEDHNLWILDDRLAFFNFFASDKRVSQYTQSESIDRPDLAFFYDTCVAWRESERMSDKVVLVEFKRPGRENYQDEDPFKQVLGYVNKFKTSGSVKDVNGNVITGIGANTAFDCYIIADLTNGLRAHIIGFGNETPDGLGMFGYTSNPRAYVEIIPYQKLLLDAKARNAVFFKKLGLSG